MDNIIQFPISHKTSPHELSELFEQGITSSGLTDFQLKEFMEIFNPILVEFDFTMDLELAVDAPPGSTISHNIEEVNAAFGKHLAQLISNRFIREFEIYVESLSFD